MAAVRRIGIVGGAIMGSAVGLFLKRRADLKTEVTIFEPDPSYRRSATFRSGASIRQQFNCAVNIEMSRFGSAFFRDARDWLGLPGQEIDLDWADRGYLVLASSNDQFELWSGQHGVEVEKGNRG